MRHSKRQKRCARHNDERLNNYIKDTTGQKLHNKTKNNVKDVITKMLSCCQNDVTRQKLRKQDQNHFRACNLSLLLE